MEAAAHVVGEYQIRSQLGRSDTSAVYLADRQGVGDPVVIRFFVPDGRLDSAALRRCQHSAATVTALKHPGLVESRDSGVYRGVPYLVAAHVPGKCLRDKLEKPLPPAQAARLLLPVARALAYLHEHHLPHGKVHAGNILASKSLLLADAGVQQLAELVGGRPGDRAGAFQKDVCALAGVFVYMITGVELPAGGLDTAQHGVAILRQARRLPGYTPAVDTLVRGALPGQQPLADAAALVQALTSAAQLEGSATRPEERAVQPAGGRTPVRQGTRRRRSGAAWLVPVVLVVLALTVGGALLIHRLNQPVSPGMEAAQPAVTAATMGAGQPAAATQPTASQAPVELPSPAAQEAAAVPATPLPLPEPTPAAGSMQISPQDGMQLLYVPAGEFPMGSDDREEDEKPLHNVYLDAFWIDRTEVTNRMYAACVQAGDCQPPASGASSQRPDYYTNAEYGDYPVIFVTWQQASDYCRWAGRRLPTEAEWEKAARGPEGYISPWGNNAPGPDQLNYNGEAGDTTRTGSYPAGASYYGAVDMAGNVWEWVSDWYSSRAYAETVYDNPTGPAEGTRRVLRGGSWYYGLNDIRAANRFSASGNTTINDIGFRCALPAAQEE